ncbi:MAG TPA: CDP-archaeol synthase [Anaerolineales bacterium]|nr:CDP-archaeol synthase [Anaerolineales bacterium]HLO34383.1 CDP-archaeol synthase [Anaerolineales bacterium]
MNIIIAHNPLEDPLFWPILRITAILFLFGFGLVLFFARKDLKAGLKGELGKRFLGWLMIAPVFLIGSFMKGVVAAIILFIFFYLVLAEYIRVVGVTRPYVSHLYIFVPITFFTAQYFPELYAVLPAAAILTLTLVPILTHSIEDLYNQLSFAGRGYLYLVWSVGHLIMIQHLAGTGLIMITAIGVALSDVMQYTVGKLIGKHIIAPEVNPRKAWEGLIGDLLGAGLAVYLLRFALPVEFSLVHQIILAFLIGVGSAWGDLISSMIKRVADVKDWGQIIPGHGGLLDRANSMVVVIPLVYYFAYIILKY